MEKKYGFSYWLSVAVRIIFGAALYAAGFRFFMYSNSITTGGVTGISMIINYLTGLPVGVMIIAINVPLFAVSWRKYGLKFMLMSLAGMGISSVLMDVYALIDFCPTDQPLLAAVYGGMCMGTGLGIIYSTSATTGGIDIIAKLLRQKYEYLNFSTLILLLDVAVIAAFAVIFRRLESAMYSAISMYISSKMIDLVLLGAVNSKVCFIITDKSGLVRDDIIHRLGRGVTFLHGEGGYTGQERKVILCVVKRTQIADVKRILQERDDSAFLIVSDSRQVFGDGFSSIYEN